MQVGPCHMMEWEAAWSTQSCDHYSATHILEHAANGTPTYGLDTRNCNNSQAVASCVLSEAAQSDDPLGVRCAAPAAINVSGLTLTRLQYCIHSVQQECWLQNR